MPKLFGRGLFGAIAFLLLAASSFATTTVTGTIQNLGTGTLGQGAFVRFWLRGCGGNIPRINGTAVIGPSQGGVYFFDMPANGSGVISGTLYSTRDVTGTLGGDIECGGSKLSVWYGMQIFVGGKGGAEVPIHAKNTATIDISNVTPITTNPVTTAPTGDTTYMRLDAGNSPATGNWAFTQGIVTPSIGPSLAQRHTIPAVTADTFSLLNAAQTLLNKSLTSPSLTTPSIGGETISSSPRILWSAVFPATFPASPGSEGISTIVLDKSVIVTRVTVNLSTAAAGCSTSPTVVLTDNTASSTKQTTTLTNGVSQFDSGAISISLPGGDTFSVSINGGVGCGTNPIRAYWTAEYKMQ